MRVPPGPYYHYKVSLLWSGSVRTRDYYQGISPLLMQHLACHVDAHSDLITYLLPSRFTWLSWSLYYYYSLLTTHLVFLLIPPDGSPLSE